MALVEGVGPVGRFGRQSSTPKVVPGAALPWHRLGRVGGYFNLVKFLFFSF